MWVPRYAARAMSTAAFGLRPLPALSLGTAFMATTFGGCGCTPAPSSTTQKSGAAIVSDDSEDPSATSPAGTYDDAIDHLSDADLARFTTLRTKLASSFDDICGDTYCGGDYNEIEPLELTCSITVATGAVKQCAYVFGGTYATLNDKTGTVTSHAKTFTCKFTVNGTMTTLLDTLMAANVTDPLQTALPGATTTIYDALGGCLP